MRQLTFEVDCEVAYVDKDKMWDKVGYFGMSSEDLDRLFGRHSPQELFC